MKITDNLVKWIINTKYENIPRDVIHEAKRSLFNWLGVAIGACYHPSVEIILSLADEVGGKEQASILGRKEKLNVLFASLVNGMTSHIFDFDDTHLETVLHPSSPVAPVVFSLGELYNLKGDDLLTAFILGAEAECRISQAVCPDHYNVGWHVTATAGNFGAAIAAGKILALDEEKLGYAIGIAATQASGLREMFGTMSKPFNPGKSAMNGLLAAMLAKKGFTSSLQGIEAKAGFANVLSIKQDYSRITDKLGEN
ncbi:MAG: MmgE/PrpD family protein [Atribacterota bacterium]